MFRDEDTTLEQVIEKFSTLKNQLDALWDIVLTGEYHSEMMSYVALLSDALDTNFDLDSQRSIQLTKLNRVQKLKNKGWYKRKSKHKTPKDTYIDEF